MHPHTKGQATQGQFSIFSVFVGFTGDVPYPDIGIKQPAK